MRRYAGLMLTLAAVFAGLAVVLLLAASLGTRGGAWDFRVGFRFLGAGVFAAGIAILLAIVGGIGARRPWTAALALATAMAAAAVPLLWMRQGRRVPPIHDITTDTSDPPAFLAVLPRRGADASPAAYDGPEVARQQHAAYPDLRPLIVQVPPRQAYDVALAVARDEGWDVVAHDIGFGELARIEAIDTTFWFGFKDDIVIRIVPHEAGARIDVRSKSRLGVSDVGTNARRIRTYLALVHERLQRR